MPDCEQEQHGHQHGENERNHDHHHGFEIHDVSDIKKIRVAFFLNLSFSILEFVFGFFTNSMAILSDALHDLGDAASLGFGWFFAHLSTKASDHEFTYGYRRFSALGALINGVILLFGAIYITAEAVPRLLAPEPVKAGWMTLIAVVGIAVNLLAAMRLQGGGTLNAKVVSLHLLEDVFGWIAVLIVSIIMLVVDIPILDPLLSLIISAWVIIQALKSLVETIKLFLQGAPYASSVHELEQEICRIPKVLEIHHTHIWSLDGQSNVFTTHLVVDQACTRDDLCTIKQAVHELTKEFHPEHTTIEIEYEGDDCLLG